MTATPHLITPGQLDADMLERAARGGTRWALDPAARPGIDASVAAVRELVARHAPAYGINTGFGSFADSSAIYFGFPLVGLPMLLTM